MTKLSISSLKTPSHRQFCFIHPSNELLVYEKTIDLKSIFLIWIGLKYTVFQLSLPETKRKIGHVIDTFWP